MSTVFPSRPPVLLAIDGSDQEFPVHRVYCVGQNYAEHTREMGGSPDREPPFFFSKPADALTTAAVVPFPRMTENLHHEVELVVALGQGGQMVDVSTAESLVFGYAIGVDLTRRDLQAAAKKKGRPWDVAKGFDHAGPISSVVPVDRSGLLDSGAIGLSVNGEQRQSGDLSQMIWSVPEIISGLSRYYDLVAGDLIFTGTPAGVGKLEPGDHIYCHIDGLGQLDFRMSKQ